LLQHQTKYRQLSQISDISIDNNDCDAFEWKFNENVAGIVDNASL
jgi:hypothetical protein